MVEVGPFHETRTPVAGQRSTFEEGKGISFFFYTSLGYRQLLEVATSCRKSSIKPARCELPGQRIADP
jgi:hypothetical protein